MSDRCNECNAPTSRTWGLWDVRSCSPGCDRALDDALELAACGGGRRDHVRAEVERLIGVPVRLSWCEWTEHNDPPAPYDMGPGFWSLSLRHKEREYAVSNIEPDSDAFRLAMALWMSTLSDENGCAW